MYKVGMWKKLVALSMIVILGVSTVVIASLQTRHVVSNGATMEQVENDLIQELRDKILIDTTLFRGSIKETKRLEKLQSFAYGYFEDVFDDTGYALDNLQDFLTEEEVELLAQIFEYMSGQTGEPYEQMPQTRFFNRQVSIRIYVHFSMGWFIGGISTALLTTGIIGLVAKTTGVGIAMGGPLGLAIGAIIGATIGASITALISNLIHRNGQGMFTQDLVRASFWMLWMNWNWQWNIADLLFDLINFFGGRWISGVVGTPRPSGQPNFSFA